MEPIKRRITFEVTDEQYNKLKDHLEYGFMKKLFSAMVDDAILMLDEYGELFVLAMISKRVSYKRMMERTESEHA